MPELMDIVDERDRVIGRATREEIHKSGALHRCVHVTVFNRKKQALLTLRAPTEDKFPNKYDLSISEHVAAGETYKEAAARGLKEELGIQIRRLNPVLRVCKNYGPNDNMSSTLFYCRYTGRLRINRAELQRAVFLPADKIRGMLKRNESIFAPWAKSWLTDYFPENGHTKLRYEDEDEF